MSGGQVGCGEDSHAGVPPNPWSPPARPMVGELSSPWPTVAATSPFQSASLLSVTRSGSSAPWLGHLLPNVLGQVSQLLWVPVLFYL